MVNGAASVLPGVTRAGHGPHHSWAIEPSAHRGCWCADVLSDGDGPTRRMDTRGTPETGRQVGRAGPCRDGVIRRQAHLPLAIAWTKASWPSSRKRRKISGHDTGRKLMCSATSLPVHVPPVAPGTPRPAELVPGSVRSLTPCGGDALREGDRRMRHLRKGAYGGHTHATVGDAADVPGC